VGKHQGKHCAAHLGFGTCDNGNGTSGNRIVDKIFAV
jgi:hypothetical protein